MIKIILVDDDPAIQDSVKMILERQGYMIDVFSNGEPLLKEAFDLPGIFILDKQLSGVDGLDVCRHLKGRQATKHIPVIILSASPHLTRLAKAAGADDFLEKPFKMRALTDMVAKYTVC